MLIRNSAGQMEAYLDGLRNYTEGSYHTTMLPAVNGETDDSCTFMYVRANSEPPAPYKTLQHHAFGGDWGFFAKKIPSFDVAPNSVGDYEIGTPDAEILSIPVDRILLGG